MDSIQSELIHESLISSAKYIHKLELFNLNYLITIILHYHPHVCVLSCNWCYFATRTREKQFTAAITHELSITIEICVHR